MRFAIDVHMSSLDLTTKTFSDPRTAITQKVTGVPKPETILCGWTCKGKSLRKLDAGSWTMMYIYHHRPQKRLYSGTTHIKTIQIILDPHLNSPSANSPIALPTLKFLSHHHDLPKGTRDRRSHSSNYEFEDCLPRQHNVSYPNCSAQNGMCLHEMKRTVSFGATNLNLRGIVSEQIHRIPEADTSNSILRESR